MDLVTNFKWISTRNIKSSDYGMNPGHTYCWQDLHPFLDVL